MAKSSKKTPKEASEIFLNIIKASVKEKAKIKKQELNIGDIYRGRKGKVRHPLIYWNTDGPETFIGIMLTHSPEDKNIALKQEHIKVQDENGNKFNFQFDNTNIVKAQLIKEEDWGPYTKVGELTEEGLKFISNYIKDNKPEYWYEIPSFAKKLKKRK